MRVRELLPYLMDVDPDSEIFLSQDSEGNGFYSVDEIVIDVPCDNSIVDAWGNQEEALEGGSDFAVVFWPKR